MEPVPPPLSAPNPPSSVDSSPRSRHTDSWDTTNYTTAPPPKLRLMCSYGGHIIPRPHDKSLCYIGGDTRIIVIDRQTSLSDLHHRLSKTLLHNQPFLLKYQLPNEDLDSLISVATDEDLDNMIDEYDRLAADSVKKKPGRLRLFLFPKSTSNSVEQLLVETASTKSEEWFLDALNGKRTLSGSDRGFSESSSVNCLLGLDDDFSAKAALGTKNNGGGVNQDMQSIPDSPMPETTSSFGSTSSSPSVVANLPPIKVRVEENVPKAVGIEDQFQQMNTNLPVKQQDEVTAGGFVAAGQVVSALPVVVGGGGDYSNRGVSDDERSDHGGGYRLVHQQQIQPQQQVHLQHQPQPQQQQIPQFQQKQQQNSAFDLHSPDSVSSEGSGRNPLARNIYQEQQYMQMQPGNIPVTANHQVDLTSGDQNIRNKVQMQPQQPQLHESGYVLSGHYDQAHPQLHQAQQFIHPGAQYIPAGAVPMASYYPIYPQRQPQNPQQPMLDQQQYPVYYLPARQNQAYNLPNYSELAPSNTSQPQTPSSATITTPPAAYKPEMAAGAYRTMAPQLVQIASNQQHQTQYMGLPQFHHPSQSMAQPSVGANPPFGYEFADPSQGQVYYTQALPPQMAAQYQTMTSAPTIVLPEAAQTPTEKVRTSQP